jgi:hypothetical protein
MRQVLFRNIKVLSLTTKVYSMNDENTKVKNSSVYNVIEILLGLAVLTSVMLDLFDFRLFIAIFGTFGLTFMLFGTALLAMGVLRLGSTFLCGFSSLTKKVNAITSVLTIMAAVIILFFIMIATGTLWLRFLFGIGLLSYGFARITVGILSSEFNSGLRTLITLLGIVIVVFSMIIFAFPFVRIHSNVYLTYGYFVNMTFIWIGIDCLASAIAGILLI